MAIKKRAAILGFATLVVVLTGRSASADVIDGEWCTVDGRQHIEIKGPSIITPGGKRMEGDYTRHSFAYVVPPQEPGAGQTVNMILVNEETVQSRMAANGVATGDGPVLVWHHCKRPVS